MRKKTLFVVLFFILLFIITKPKPHAPVISLKADKIIIEVKDEFSLDLLSMYVDAQTEAGERISFKELEINGAVDPQKTGIYQLEIVAKDPVFNLTKKVDFIVEVKDTISPEIISLVDTIIVYDTETINLDPATNLIFAYDINDGMITDKMIYEGVVKSKAGIYPVVYTVSDESGNSTSKTINYKVTYSMDEFLHYVYEKAINVYWGKYFITSKNKEILNYNEVVNNTFTISGLSQFNRGCGLEDNTDGTRGGVRLEQRDNKIYLLDEKESIVNNYDSTVFVKVSNKSGIIKYQAESTYFISSTKSLKVKNDFSIKKTHGKYYIESFILPNS